jgi:hypothetical protein
MFHAMVTVIEQKKSSQNNVIDFTQRRQKILVTNRLIVTLKAIAQYVLKMMLLVEHENTESTQM